MRSKSFLELFATALLLLLSCGALVGTTGCKGPSATIEPMMFGARLDPPLDGKNKIWIEFQDQTAQGGGFEDTLFESVQDAVSERGYAIVRFPSEADYVLWATLRRFQKVSNEGELEEILESLGGVAGAMDESAPGSELSDRDPNASVTADLIGSGIASGLTKMVTGTKFMIMICDVQLGTRRNAVDDASSDGQAGAEDASTTDSSTSAKAVAERFYLQNVQRLLATAKGSRMNEADARNLLVPRIVDAIKVQLPRYRGN